jgi:cysteine desulfurase / selenocysteine lyase
MVNSVDRIDQIRQQFPVTRKKAYLNHAAHSPLPQPVANAMRKFTDEYLRLGDTSLDCEPKGKPQFAKLIGARPEEIALTENTSMGLSLVANMLRYPRGSKIVTTDMEYSSVVYPWLRKDRGVKVYYVKSDGKKVSLDDMEKAVDDKTVAVAISHVSYFNGFRHNLKVLSEIVHEHGAYLIVDAIQSVGTMPIDVSRDDVDFLSCACYKWLLSPEGAAYFFVRDELIEKFEPPMLGWASVDQKMFQTVDFWDIWNPKLSKTASRFEAGSHATISFVGATEGMKMLLNQGIDNVKSRIIKLTDHLIGCIERLGLELQTPKDKQCRSGIVNFKIKNPQKIVERLKKKHIIVSARANGIRVSPHFYNTEEEIDSLVTEVKKAKG